MESQERIMVKELSRLFIEIGKKVIDFEEGMARIKASLKRLRRTMEL